MKRITEAKLPTRYGDFKIFVYSDRGIEHVALVAGEIKHNSVLVRIHSRCLTGDVFGSRRCDCQEQLTATLKKISQQRRGILIYLNQEGRGIGLANKIRAYSLQDQGLDTVEANEYLGFRADLRDYEIAAEILKDLGAIQIHLLTNNPEKIRALEKASVTVTKRIPLETEPTKENYQYLVTKKRRLNHLLCLPESLEPPQK